MLPANPLCHLQLQSRVIELEQRNEHQEAEIRQLQASHDSQTGRLESAFDKVGTAGLQNTKVMSSDFVIA